MNLPTARSTTKKYVAKMTHTVITTHVDPMVISRLGQDTFLSSTFTSFRNCLIFESTAFPYREKGPRRLGITKAPKTLYLCRPYLVSL